MLWGCRSRTSRLGESRSELKDAKKEVDLRGWGIEWQRSNAGPAAPIPEPPTPGDKPAHALQFLIPVKELEGNLTCSKLNTAEQLSLETRSQGRGI